MDTDKPAGRVGHGRSVRKRYRRLSMLLVAVAAAIAFGVFMLLPPSMPDLSESAVEHRQFLHESWASGDSIVVVRHLERCDRADVPCLVAEDGLTARSVSVAAELSDDFFQLGLHQADIYHSPLARTEQTADLLFSSRSRDRQWLFDCRKQDTLLRDALAYKKPGRNLVLVTHSSCIARFEEEFGLSSDTPGYGTSIFLSAEPRRRDLRLLGYVDVDDWDFLFNLE